VSFALGMIKNFQRKKELKRVNSKQRSDRNLKVFCTAIAAVAIFSLFFNVSLASDISVQKVIDLTNADRSEKGLSILTENNKLKKAAENKAEDMIKNNYFSHNSPEGVTPWHWMEQEKYDYDYAGENLAMDFTAAEKMNDAWLASPTHRANILNEKYKDIGIAVKEGMINGHSTIDVVQMFGSGDRSKKDDLQNEKISVQKTDQKKTYFPLLPLENKKDPRAASLALAEPIITSPQSNEQVSQKALEVVGRSAPGEKISIWDNSQEMGQTFSDGEGWFHLKLSILTEGKHDLKAQGETKFGQRQTAENTLSEVSIFVDRSKPQVKYHLWANEDKLNEYILEASSDKPNCIFEIGGKTVSAGKDRTAIIPISGGNLSTILKVKDQAGNKTAEQVVLANYYQGNGQHNIVDEMAQMIFSEKAFAVDSGRGALKKNLGIAIADYNH
jgi:hypothetical protein